MFFAQALPGSVSLLSHLWPASLSFFSWTASSVQVFSSCALSQAFSNLQKQSRIALDAPFRTTNRLGLFVCHSDASGLSLHSRTHVLEYCNWHDDIWTLLVDGISIFMYIRFILIRHTAQMSLACSDLECSWISKKSCPTARCTEDNIWPGRGRVVSEGNFDFNHEGSLMRLQWTWSWTILEFSRLCHCFGSGAVRRPHGPWISGAHIARWATTEIGPVRRQG